MGCGAAVGVYLLGVPRVPSLEGSGPVGSGGLTSRVCVFTKGTSPSRIVPSYNLLQVGAHAEIRRMVSAQPQEDMHMFMCMRTTARGAARRGSSRRPLQKGQEIKKGSSATAS